MTYDIYSERLKQNKQELYPYRYDEISEKLRNQIFYVLKDVMQDTSPYGIGEWEKFWNEFCQERGLSWYQGNDHACRSAFHDYLVKEQNKVEEVLVAIDIAFQFVANQPIPEYKRQFAEDACKAYKKAVNDLNTYFRRESVGYQLVENRMMRIGSDHLHSEVVMPTLNFLRSSGFESANREFLSALEKYRSGDYRHCITDANSAFESVMKVICKRRGGKCGKGTASKLVEALSNEKIVPGYLQKHFQEFEQLLSTLKSGLPVFRDNEGSVHGRGEKSIKAYAYMAGYAIHLAAANILFLVQAYESSSDETSDNNTSTLIDEMPS